MADRPDVTARLREAAARHHPDRERMLARMTAGMAPREHPGEARSGRSSWSPRAGASAGLVAVLAVGGIAVGWVTEYPPARGMGSEPGVQTPPAGGTASTGATRTRPATPARPSTAPTATGGWTSDGGDADDRRRSPVPDITSRSAASPSSSPPTSDGALRAEATVDPGSNAYWGRHDLELYVAERLTALTVELRLRRTEGLRYQDAWHTLPSQDVTERVEEVGDALVFRWTLRRGASVPPGTYQFAAQYHHPEGRRDASGDRFRVGAEGPAGALRRDGDFR